MENRTKLKLLHLLLMATPFLVPWFMILAEKIFGTSVGWFYAMVVLFAISLIALYIWGIVSTFQSKNRDRILLGLIKFHIVKIPLFVLAWIIHTIVYLMACLHMNGLEGVQ